MNNINIAIVGGDRRCIFASEKLSEIFSVTLCGFDKYHNHENRSHLVFDNDCEKVIGKSDITVLPIPFSCDFINVNAPYSSENIPLDSIIENSKIIIGGCLSPEFTAKCEDFGIIVYDCYKRDELKILNAIPTAEGTLSIIINNTDFTVKDSKCLVISFGKVGEAVARSLIANGAKVTVAARKAEFRARAANIGCKSITTEEISKKADDFNVIINAAPALVINEDVLDRVKEDCLIIDLASRPGGVALSYAEKLGKKVIWALSIPNKIAPKTAGLYFASTVENIIKEEIL